MEYQCSNLFLMQHLSSISQQKIYPTNPIKIEMPLWKTLHITRLWNHAREQEIYLSQQQQQQRQQQQKNDWWIHQMAGSHHASLQPLDNYLPPSWLDDTTSATIPTLDTTTASELATCQLGPSQYDTTTNDGLDLAHDDDDDDDEEEDPETVIATTQTDTTTDQTHATKETLLAKDGLAPLLDVSTQDRKRKHEGDPSTSQANPTPPPAARCTTSPPSSMVQV